MRDANFTRAIILIAITSATSPSIGFASESAKTPSVANDSTAAVSPSLQKTYTVKGMHCQPCADSITAALLKLDEVQAANVQFKSKKAVVTYKKAITPEAEAKVKAAVARLDYEIL